MDKKIDFYRTEDGDWETLRCQDDDFTIENHRLDSDDWIFFLEHLGFSVNQITISDDLTQDEDW